MLIPPTFGLCIHLTEVFSESQGGKGVLRAFAGEMGNKGIILDIVLFKPINI